MYGSEEVGNEIPSIVPLNQTNDHAPLCKDRGALGIRLGAGIGLRVSDLYNPKLRPSHARLPFLYSIVDPLRDLWHIAGLEVTDTPCLNYLNQR